MSTEATSPLPVVTAEQTAASTPAEPDKVASQAEKPEATEQAQKDAAPGDGSQEGEEKKPTQGELNRRERNRERWRNMKQEAEESRRRAEYAEAEVRRLRSMSQQDYTKMEPDEALAERTAARLREGQAADIERTALANRQRSVAAMHQAWEAHAEDARAEYPDFDAVFAKTPIHERAAPFIAQSEKGGDLAYWLGTHPTEARALYDLFEANPVQALIEFGRIEAGVNRTPAKSTSKAPPPPHALQGGRTPAAIDLTKADTNDVAAFLRKAGIIG